MQLLVLTLSILATVVFLTADCRDLSKDPTESLDGDHQLKEIILVRADGSQDLVLPVGREKRDSGEKHHKLKNGKRETKRKNTRDISCAEAGGTCMSRKEAKKICLGIIDNQYKCDRKKRYCCIPNIQVCPNGDGFFSPPCTNKCFKFFNSKWRNYTEAEGICNTNGMKLPHPYNAVALRSYLLQRFGLAYYWMDARGIGPHFRWQNGIDIINSNPLWLNNPEGGTDSSYCMVMVAHSYYWNISLTAPYVSWLCSEKLATMCELF